MSLTKIAERGDRTSFACPFWEAYMPRIMLQAQVVLECRYLVVSLLFYLHSDFVWLVPSLVLAC